MCRFYQLCCAYRTGRCGQWTITQTCYIPDSISDFLQYIYTAMVIYPWTPSVAGGHYPVYRIFAYQVKMNENSALEGDLSAGGMLIYPIDTAMTIFLHQTLYKTWYYYHDNVHAILCVHIYNLYVLCNPHLLYTLIWQRQEWNKCDKSNQYVIYLHIYHDSVTHDFDTADTSKEVIRF